MKQNMGSLDKALRIAAAMVVAVLYFTKVIDGTTALVLGILAVVFVMTSFIGVCPLYLPFGISTRKLKQ